MRKKEILFICVLLVFACTPSKKKEEKPTISEEKMVEIYRDIRILESARYHSINDSTIFKDGYIHYEDVFKRHGVESSEAKKAHEYYLKHPTELSSILEKVEEQLHKEKTRIDVEMEGGSKKLEVESK